MFNKKLLAKREARPFGLLRQMTTELDRMFDEPFKFEWPNFEALTETTAWAPKVDVLEKDNRLITRVDLPGVTKDNVSVEIVDGYLVLTGERKNESEEKKDDFYRAEREYGTFCRAVPLPEGVKPEDVKATFANGVLEVSVPLPAKVEPPKARKIEIQEPAKAAAKSAA